MIEEWVEQCRRGKTRAYAQIVKAMQQKVLGFLFRMTQNRELAEDLGQEVFLMAYRRIGQYDRTKAAFSTWLFTLARNLCLDELRKCKIPKVSLEEAAEVADVSGSNPQQTVQEKELEARIAAAVADLESEFREVFILRDYQHFAMEEIAQITGLPLGTVKSRLHRARLHLQAQLAPLLEDWR